MAELLAETDHRYTYRFLFAPGTIGAISWLARHEAEVDRIRGGLVLACVGDGGPLTYKRSRRGDTEMDRAAEHVLTTRDAPSLITDFSPYGNDERQFCSPGFDLPIGSVTRSGRHRSDRDHTSADDMASILPHSLTDTLEACLAIIAVLEGNATVASLHPKCEPQLGRYGLYRSFGGHADQLREMAFLWVMSYADGAHSTLDVAQRSGLPFDAIRDAALALEGAGLVTMAPSGKEGER
jgi:aminopeptidase-like protein